jgi:ribosomal protein L14
MPATKGTYKGQSVEITRAAKQGDKDFNANLGEQVIVRLKDNTEKTVPKAEVTEAE